MRVAAATFELSPIRRVEEFEYHIEDLVGQAVRARAELIVFPELPVLELLGLAPDLRQGHIASFLAGFATCYEETLSNLAQRHGVTIVGGSHIDVRRRNVCAVASPDGRLTFHTKNVLTRWEADEWGLIPGEGLANAKDPRIGVLICYDSEFPEAGRAYAEDGKTLIIVPSYTETVRGFQRVRWSCLARALENQVFVIHASLVGTLNREPVPSTYGSSAIIAPSVEPFPESAILDETKLNKEGIAMAELDFSALALCRETGDVRNWNDRRSGRWEFN